MRRGPSPLDRRRRVRGRLRSPRKAKPKRSHACVANPLRVDRGRPHPNQGKPIRERGWYRKQGVPKRAYLVARITKLRVLCKLCHSMHSRLSASRVRMDKIPVRVRVKLLPTGSAVLLVGSSGRLRQGWQPARGKTRLRGFSAANSPARRATPNFALEHSAAA